MMFTNRDFPYQTFLMSLGIISHIESSGFYSCCGALTDNKVLPRTDDLSELNELLQHLTQRFPQSNDMPQQ